MLYLWPNHFIGLGSWQGVSRVLRPNFPHSDYIVPCWDLCVGQQSSSLSKHVHFNFVSHTFGASTATECWVCVSLSEGCPYSSISHRILINVALSQIALLNSDDSLFLLSYCILNINYKRAVIHWWLKRYGCHLYCQQSVSNHFDFQAWKSILHFHFPIEINRGVRSQKGN